MKIIRKITDTQFFFLLGMLFFVGSCTRLSEFEIDKSAGLNGGFEVSRNGLPVNWLIYTSNTVTEADFKIVLDKDVFKEGQQSLRFDVQKCSSVGGWKSPGFTNEFFEIGKFKGEARYKVGFWIRNDGTEFAISAGGVAAQKGNMSILIKKNKQIMDWKYYEYHIDIPADRWLRIELNILQSGTFWIDDLQIEKE